MSKRELKHRLDELFSSPAQTEPVDRSGELASSPSAPEAERRAPAVPGDGGAWERGSVGRPLTRAEDAGEAEDITERKRAEEALLDVTERLQQLVEHSGDAFFLHDRAGRILEVNQQACDSLGYTREELLNLWLQDIVPRYKPSDPDEWGDGVYPGIKITSEGVHRRKDGTLFPVEARIGAFESGGRKLVLALCRDVTERKRAEEELRESETRKRAILESALDCIISIDHQGRIVEFNPAAEKTFGYAGDEVIGKEMAELIIPPSLRPQHRRGLAHYLATGEGPVLGKRIEITALRADGSEFPVELAITPIHLGQHPVFTASVRDITERKQTEEALRESEALYHSLVETLPQNLFRKDLEGRFTFGNQRFCDSLGKSLAEIIGKTDFDFYPPELAEKYRRDDQRVLETGETFETVEEHQPPDGEKIYVQVIKTPIYDFRGEILGTQCLFWEVTERERAEAERERLLADLERRALQLQTAAEVSQSTSSMLDLDELLPTTTELIRSRFNLYYVGIFLVDAAGQYAVLRAGSGEAGRLMVERSHRLAVGGASMIGWCVANQKARIALDVGEEAVRFDNPALPETRSELALPLISRGQMLGAMTVQSAREAAFSEVDIAVLQTMADQVANAIANARLYEQAQAALAEAHRLAQREQLINQLAGKMRAAVSVDEVLRIASDELRRATHATRVAARLSAPARANGNGQSTSGSQRETTPSVGVTDER